VNALSGSPSRKLDIMAHREGTSLMSLSHTGMIVIQRYCYNEKNEEKRMFSAKND